TAVLNALTSGISGERIILCGHNMKYKDVMNRLADKMNRPTGRFEIKPWTAHLAWIIGLFSKKPPLITPQTVRSTAEESSYNNAKSLRLLNMTYTSIEETLDRMVRIYSLEKSNLR